MLVLAAGSVDRSFDIVPPSAALPVQPVKTLVLLVTWASSLGNLLCYFQSDPAAVKANTGWCYIVFVLCLGLVLTFLVLFWRALMDSAKLDAKPAAPASTMAGAQAQKAGGGDSDAVGAFDVNVVVNPMRDAAGAVRTKSSLALAGVPAAAKPALGGKRCVCPCSARVVGICSPALNCTAA